MQRRHFFHSLGASAVGIPLLGSDEVSNTPEKTEEPPILVAGDRIAVADTAYGKIRGFILRGVHTFLGIPYGADTGGSLRFMPPSRPKPWTGIRPAIWWGNSAPQITENRYAQPMAAFTDHWNYDDLSEDCLRLNVWTPALDNSRRPVLLWLHGGGFIHGNAHEQDGYHGENLARHGDVVFVSVNHRLGPLGYCSLVSSGGPAASGNAGNLDLIAALEWVREHIASFGGDAGNVTLIGQSGGGAKVTSLMNMPAARGLFHKAVALSGSSLSGIDAGYAAMLGDRLYMEAGLRTGELEKLQELPWLSLLQAAQRATLALAGEARRMGIQREGFSPVADGVHLLQEPFFSTSLSAEIPMLINTTFHEWNPARGDASLEQIDMAGVVEKLRPRFGERTEPICAAYRELFPKASPMELWALIVSNRKQAVAAADAKFRQGKAPVYLAWFGWEPPHFDGRMRSFHCIDICFWFLNTDRMYTHTGGGSRPRALAQKMADSLVRFARTGSPNGGGLPFWEPYTTAKGETMILNDACTIQYDPDGDARRSLG